MEIIDLILVETVTADPELDPPLRDIMAEGNEVLLVPTSFADTTTIFGDNSGTPTNSSTRRNTTSNFAIGWMTSRFFRGNVVELLLPLGMSFLIFNIFQRICALLAFEESLSALLLATSRRVDTIGAGGPLRCFLIGAGVSCRMSSFAQLRVVGNLNFFIDVSFICKHVRNLHFHSVRDSD